MSNLLLKHTLNRNLQQILTRHSRNLSEQLVIKTKPLEEQKRSDEDFRSTLQTTEKFSQMYARKVSKKPQRPPFLKNLFLGKFDSDILTYPEALDKESVDRLERELQSVQFYFDNSEDATKKDFWDMAKQLKLLGLEAPQLVGGRELNTTESLRYSEVIAQKSSDIQLLTSEQAVRVLLTHGNERQITKYVQDITAGNITMAICIEEDGGVDPQQFTMSAKYDDNKKEWILNGRKLHVANGNCADLFIVFAKTNINASGFSQTNVSAFLVERTHGGVTSKPNHTLGVNKSDISEVIFENTHVPKENLLGKENKGLEIYAKALPDIHLKNAIAACTITKNSFNKYFDYCRDVSKEGNNLLETCLVHEKLSDFASRIYAMESMIYLTAGLLDIYADQDCQMEAAITKLFSAEHSAAITSHITHLLGPAAYRNDHWANASHRDAAYYSFFNGTPDGSKIILALQGLQFAGVELQDLIKRIRNPLFHTKEVFTRMWTQRRQNNDNPRLTLQLHQYLHPSAMSGAEWLEYCVLRLQYATELLLAHYGLEVMNKHTDLVRMADCAMDIYAMVATVGRASRSYCIGLAGSDYEIVLALAFCRQATQRVKRRVQLIAEGPYVSNDVAHGKLAEKIVHEGRYFPAHPLARNY